jgi:hypothetical protein
MANDIEPLPVKVSPEQGESGQGFLLRVASRNALSLKAMLRWTGCTSLQTLAPGSIPAIAHATQASATWLRRNLPLNRSRAQLKFVEWHGHDWAMPLARRGWHGQICAQCLREGTPCQSVWEMTGSFACLRHRRLLIDRCPRCKAPISWARPATDVCRCGRYLSAGQDAREIDEGEAAWTSSMLTMLQSPGGVAAGLTLRPSWLTYLSPEGLFTIAFAAGVRERPGDGVLPSSSKIRSSPERNAKTLMLGLRRLAGATFIDDQSPAALRDLIFEQSLERLCARGTTQANVDIGRDLLAWLRRVPRRGLSLTGRRPLGQLNLFEGTSP